jgi:hypothetical protein
MQGAGGGAGCEGRRRRGMQGTAAARAARGVGEENRARPPEERKGRRRAAARGEDRERPPVGGRGVAVGEGYGVQTPAGKTKHSRQRGGRSAVAGGEDEARPPVGIRSRAFSGAAAPPSGVHLLAAAGPWCWDTCDASPLTTGSVG